MKTYINPDRSLWPELTQRPEYEQLDLQNQVQSILDKVKEGGDRALLDLTKKFDHIDLPSIKVPVPKDQITIPAVLSHAIDLAFQNIEKFHRAQIEVAPEIETMPGVTCWRKSIPIKSVGLYIPGGTAPLFSTLLMLGLPARLAGCHEIVVCSPPQPDGKLHSSLLYTAQKLGLENLFAVGGAQAIAAMSCGTTTIPRVDKIFGPGNQFVTKAKQLVSLKGTAIDMPAGPSEVAVLADQTANPAFVAADLLSQAEHGPDSQVVLATDSETLVGQVSDALERQLKVLPREKLARESLSHSKAMVFSDLSEAMEFSNAYAPEHLIINTKDAAKWGQQVQNAGSVFLGAYAPESVGDYASGTNHTLPTNGHSRAYAGVSVDSFVKKVTFQNLTLEGLQSIGPAVATMADAEGLEGHKNAVNIRLDQGAAE
ncbi:MAG: histidinol dehydrogenase [Cyclobacteriaceae bacterium]